MMKMKWMMLSLAGMLLCSCGIGTLPEKAPETVKDPAALKMYEKARGGDMDSLRSLADCYSKGKLGFPRNSSRVHSCWKMLGDRGDVNAQRSLGMAYLHGNGLMKSEDSAKYWLGKAAAQGDAPSKRGLALLKVNGEQEKMSSAVADYYTQKSREDSTQFTGEVLNKLPSVFSNVFSSGAVNPQSEYERNLRNQMSWEAGQRAARY